MNTKLRVCTEIITCLWFLPAHIAFIGQSLCFLTVTGVGCFQYDDIDEDFLSDPK